MESFEKAKYSSFKKCPILIYGNPCPNIDRENSVYGGEDDFPVRGTFVDFINQTAHAKLPAASEHVPVMWCHCDSVSYW